LHVEQAMRIEGVSARIGDARELPYEDGAWDVVLLLGPLYHLPKRADRIRALTEAKRVARPGALVAAAQISRYAGLHDLLRLGRYFEPGIPEHTAEVLRTGHLPAGGPFFTDAYFHDPAEIAEEFAEAGLRDAVPHGLEGAAWLMGAIETYLEDPGRRNCVLEALRSVETAPSVLGVSGHILTTGRA
jgi:SAM-dependent methyltransferase